MEISHEDSPAHGKKWGVALARRIGGFWWVTGSMRVSQQHDAVPKKGHAVLGLR